MRENREQKISENAHFLRSVTTVFIFVLFFEKGIVTLNAKIVTLYNRNVISRC